MRRILVIGGNGFMGYQLVWRLIAAGEAVTILNRGHKSDPFGDLIQRIRVDRTTPAFREALHDQAFDAVVDFAAFTAEDVAGAVTALMGRVGHYIFISSGAAYLVREGMPVPPVSSMAEALYAGALRPCPDDPEAAGAWHYGMGKRAAEAVLDEAWTDTRFPSTRLRLPNVNGERDPSRRLETYLWRIIDGGPVLLPDYGRPMLRHVYSGDVVKTIQKLLGDARTFGQAYNLAQDEELSLSDFVGLLAQILGAPDRSIPMSALEIREAGLSPTALSPLSGPWNSRLDPRRAKTELGFSHEPATQYLGKVVASFLSCPPLDRPAAYASRGAERDWAVRRGG